MSYSNGKITVPVSISDVKTVLGESSNDLATLCKSSKINMWARFKPTVYPAPFPSDWYKAGDGNYGITIPVYTSIKDLYAAYHISGDTSHRNGYTYNQPYGGSVSPYRLGDFRGYRHNSQPPIGGFTTNTRVVTNAGVTGSCAYRLTSATGDDGQFTLAEMGDLKNCYFGFALFKNGSAVYWKTASSTISSSNSQMSITIGGSGTNLATGTYEAVPFLSTAKYDTGAIQNPVVGKWYPIPNASTTTVVVETSQNALLRDMSLSFSGGTITLKNKGTTKHTRVYLHFRFQSSNANSQFVSGEYQGVVNNITMAAGDTITMKKVGNIITYGSKTYTLDSSKQYKAVLYVETVLVDEVPITDFSEIEI